MSCDWGTSSFRLRLFHSGSDSVVAEVTASAGIAAIYDRCKKEPDRPRFSFYQGVLQKSIDELSRNAGFSMTGVPVVISGMASSSIGIRELAYATLPFPLDGNRAVTLELGPTTEFPHEILLISGLKSDRDIMRGEETQLLGLAAHGILNGESTAVCIFPGTHSKHIRVQNGVVADFETYMTGEFFQLLSCHSILHESLEMPDDAKDIDLSPEAKETFLEGVQHAAGTNLLHAAFSTRTDHLFGKRDKANGFYFLSGLLIGAELNGLKNEKAATVVLCGGGSLSFLYALALRRPGMPERIIVVPPETADLSVVYGHCILLERQR